MIELEISGGKWEDIPVLNKDITDIASQLNCISGSTMSTNDTQKKIQQAQLRSISERGRVPLRKMDYQPHRTTLHIYAAIIVIRSHVDEITSW